MITLSGSPLASLRAGSKTQDKWVSRASMVGEYQLASETLPVPLEYVPPCGYHDHILTSLYAEFRDGVGYYDWNYEGLVEYNNPIVDYDSATQVDPITFHPRINEFIKKYSKGFRGGVIQWSRDDPTGKGGNGLTPDGQKATNVNPLYNVTSFLNPSATFSKGHLYKTKSDIPDDLMDGIGFISSDPPKLAQDRTWLKTGIELSQVGSGFFASKNYMASGLGGWNDVIYTPPEKSASSNSPSKLSSPKSSSPKLSSPKLSSPKSSNSSRGSYDANSSLSEILSPNPVATGRYSPIMVGKRASPRLESISISLPGRATVSYVIESTTNQFSVSPDITAIQSSILLSNWTLTQRNSEWVDGYYLLRWVYEAAVTMPRSPEDKRDDADAISVYRASTTCDQEPLTSHPKIGEIMNTYGGYLMDGQLYFPVNDPTGKSGRSGYDTQGDFVSNINPFYNVDSFFSPQTLFQRTIMSGGSTLPIDAIDSIGILDDASLPDFPFLNASSDAVANWLKTQYSSHQQGNDLEFTEAWRSGGIGGWKRIIYDPSYST